MKRELDCPHYRKWNGKNNTITFKVLKPPLEVDKNIDYFYELKAREGEGLKKSLEKICQSERSCQLIIDYVTFPSEKEFSTFPGFSKIYIL